MADTSRIRLWTMPVIAIAAALSLAACGSSGSSGGGGSGPTSTATDEPWELVPAAEAILQEAEDALADAMAEYNLNNNLRHVFSGGAAHLHLNGGDSAKAIEQVRALYATQAAIGDEGVEGDPDAGVEGVAPSGYVGEILGLIMPAIADLEAQRDAAGDGSIVAYYNRRIAELEGIRDAALAVRDQVAAEVMRVTRGNTRRMGYTEDTPDRDERDVANSVAMTLENMIHYDRYSGSSLTTLNTAIWPHRAEPAPRVRMFATADGMTGDEILHDLRELLVERPKGTSMTALPLDGARVAGFTAAVRFTESDDTTMDRLSPDGDGWIAAGGTEVLQANRFSIGRAFPAPWFWEGFQAGGTVHCLGECSVEDGRFAGDWYAEFAEPAGEAKYGRWQRRVTPAGLSEYEEVPEPYLAWGYWVAANERIQFVVRKRSFGGRGEDFNIMAADVGDQDPLNDEATATYSGPTAGVSVRTETRMEGEGDDAVEVTDYHSGHFLADAELTVTFADAQNDRSLSGTIDNFRAAEGENPQAVDSAWTVSLERSLVDSVGVTFGSATVGSDATAPTPEDDRDAGDSWDAYGYGNKPAARPLGFFGVFKTTFPNGSASGVFATRKDPAD